MPSFLNSRKIEKNKTILYISYDGMTDPLGQSQVIPYIQGLARKGYKFVLLSAEKKERFSQNKAKIQTLLDQDGIEWVPISFSTSPPFLSKLYDVKRLKKMATKLHKEYSFDMVHCRSYIAIDVALYLRKKHNVKVFFDMRGFWVDERVDGGMWNISNPLFKMVYNHYKKKEVQYISGSDYIISLTESGKKEIMSWPSYNGCNIKVIPCCADFDHFTIKKPEEYVSSRMKFGFKDDDLVISYLGSLGTWYMIDEMLDFFQVLKKNYASAQFLFITKDEPSIILDRLSEYHLSKEDIVITEAKREEVPAFVKASDINLSFIKPAYSKIASSPTKLGEVLAMGIPVICNHIGDVRDIIENTNGGVCIDDFNHEVYNEVVSEVPNLLKRDGTELREKSFAYYDLKRAHRLYAEAYEEVFS